MQSSGRPPRSTRSSRRSAKYSGMPSLFTSLPPSRWASRSRSSSGRTCRASGPTPIASSRSCAAFSGARWLERRAEGESPFGRVPRTMPSSSRSAIRVGPSAPRSTRTPSTLSPVRVDRASQVSASLRLARSSIFTEAGSGPHTMQSVGQRSRSPFSRQSTEGTCGGHVALQKLEDLSERLPRLIPRGGSEGKRRGREAAASFFNSGPPAPFQSLGRALTPRASMSDVPHA